MRAQMLLIVCKHQSPSPLDCVLVWVRDHEIHAISNYHLQAREGLGEVVCITPFFILLKIFKHSQMLNHHTNSIANESIVPAYPIPY